MVKCALTAADFNDRTILALFFDDGSAIRTDQPHVTAIEVVQVAGNGTDYVWFRVKHDNAGDQMWNSLYVHGVEYTPNA